MAAPTRPGNADDRSRENHQVPHGLPMALGGPLHRAACAGVDVGAAPAFKVVARERGHGSRLRNFGCSELGDRLTRTWTRRALIPWKQADLGHELTVRPRAPWPHRPVVRKTSTPSVLRTGAVGTALGVVANGAGSTDAAPYAASSACVPVKQPPANAEDRPCGGAASTRNRLPVHRPALASARAGTPTSRNVAAVIWLCLHHEAATFTRASSSSGSLAAWFSRASSAMMASRRCTSRTSSSDRTSALSHCSNLGAPAARASPVRFALASDPPLTPRHPCPLSAGADVPRRVIAMHPQPPPSRRRGAAHRWPDGSAGGRWNLRSVDQMPVGVESVVVVGDSPHGLPSA